MLMRLFLLLLCFPLLSCAPDTPEKHDKMAHAGVKEYLDKGYRGYEYYADPRSITTALFDVSKNAGVEIQEAPSYEGHFVYGQSR